MCDVGAHCPNCDHAGLDEDEVECRTVNGLIMRRYLCHHCGAETTVRVPPSDEDHPVAVIRGGRDIDR